LNQLAWDARNGVAPQGKAAVNSVTRGLTVRLSYVIATICHNREVWPD